MASGRLIDYLGAGLASARPATPNLVSGAVGLYFSTDTGALSAWDGAAWSDVSLSFLAPSGGFSDGALIAYDAYSGSWIEVPPGPDGYVLGMTAGFPDWTTAGSVSSVNGQSGAVILGLDSLIDVMPGTGAPANGDVLRYVASEGNWRSEPPLQSLAIACSDESTALTTGTNKVKFINPYPTKFVVVDVVASLSTAQTSGSIFTVDINEAGSSILSTKLTIDNGETVGGSNSSAGSATPAVVSDQEIAAYAQISVDIDQVGDGTAKGLKVYLIGYALPG